MTTIQLASGHFSQKEQVEVEDRGGFGKLYVLHRHGRAKGELEGVLLWTGHGVSYGPVRPSDEVVGRAVRALAEYPPGATVLGFTKEEAPPKVIEATYTDDDGTQRVLKVVNGEIVEDVAT